MGLSPEKGAFMPQDPDESVLYAAQQNCSCYKKGHNLHWIAVLKKWPDEPRIPVSIFEAPDEAFLVEAADSSKVFYCHAPARLAALIKRHGSANWQLVGNTGAITTPKQPNGAHTWSYLSEEPVSNCEKNRCECYSPDDIWDED